VEKGTITRYWWECKLVQPIKVSMEVPPKTKNRTTNDPAIPVLGVYPKKAKLAYFRDVYCCTFHDSQAVESA
jgi:hypothetical protein